MLGLSSYRRRWPHKSYRAAMILNGNVPLPQPPGRGSILSDRSFSGECTREGEQSLGKWKNHQRSLLDLSIRHDDRLAKPPFLFPTVLWIPAPVLKHNLP